MRCGESVPLAPGCTAIVRTEEGERVAREPHQRPVEPPTRRRAELAHCGSHRVVKATGLDRSALTLAPFIVSRRCQHVRFADRQTGAQARTLIRVLGQTLGRGRTPSAFIGLFMLESGHICDRVFSRIVSGIRASNCTVLATLPVAAGRTGGSSLEGSRQASVRPSRLNSRLVGFIASAVKEEAGAPTAASTSQASEG